jgi:hypothetical protein
VLGRKKKGLRDIEPAKRPASIKAGEISREPETAERARTDLLPNAGKQTKAKALADAGLSTSTANRLKELAGERQDEGRQLLRRAG